MLGAISQTQNHRDHIFLFCAEPGLREKRHKSRRLFGKRKGASGKGAGRMGGGMCVNTYMRM